MLSQDAIIENCVRGILDVFNQDPENFNSTRTRLLLLEPCKSEFVRFGWFDSYVDAVVANIKDRFKCLYYSYLNRVLERKKEEIFSEKTWLIEKDDENTVCGKEGKTTQELDNYEYKNSALFETNLVSAGGFYVWTSSPDLRFFDYKFPAVLPSRTDRFKKGSLFKYDIYLTQTYSSEFGGTGSTAEDLIIAVFDEFSSCAVSAKFVNHANG